MSGGGGLAFGCADFGYLAAATRWDRDTWVDAWHLAADSPRPETAWHTAVLYSPLRSPLETVIIVKRALEAKWPTAAP